VICKIKDWFAKRTVCDGKKKVHHITRMKQPQSRSSTSGLGCPSAMCTDGHPKAYAWTCCSLWTNCD